MNRTGIEYLTHSWNPLAMRCSKISEGCANCWHLAMADRLAKNPMIPEFRQKAYAGGEPVLIEDELEAPLKLKKPSIIGVQFMGDLFHEKVAVDHIDRIIDIIDRCSYAHKFVILTKRPENIEEKLFTFYNNDKKRRFSDDYLPENLEIVTYSQNMKHAYQNNLADEHGEKNPSAKLTDEQVVKIRELYATRQFTQKDVGEMFGVAFQTISKIVRGNSRKKQMGETNDYTDMRKYPMERDIITGRFIGKKKAGIMLDDSGPAI